MPMSPESPVSSNDQLTSWPFPHVYAGFKAIKEKEAPRHEGTGGVAQEPPRWHLLTLVL